MSDNRSFSGFAGRWSKFEEFNGHAFATLNDISRRLVQSETLSTEEKLEKLETMKECAITIHRIGAEAKQRVETCNRLAKISQSAEDRNADCLRAVFKKCATEAIDAAELSVKTQSGADLQQVNAHIRTVSVTEQDDVDIQDIQDDQAQLSRREMRCPITGSVLQNPLKNPQCDHVYSAQGALHLLFQNNANAHGQTHGTNGFSVPNNLDQVPGNWKATCPIAGCNKFFTRTTLKRDYQMELTQRQRQQTSSSPRRDSMDLLDEIG